MGEYPVHKVIRSSAEMTVLFGLMGSGDDRVLVDIDIPQDYPDYLQSLGIKCARPVKNGNFSGYQGVAWGWNKQALSRLSDTGATCDAPDLSIIKKINSREFCSEIGRRFGLGVPGSLFCKSSDDLSGAFNALKDSFPLVIKPAFGTSGFGFLFLQSPSQAKSFLESSNTIVDRGGAVVEPWCERTHDLSSSVTIFQDGSISSPVFRDFTPTNMDPFSEIL